MEPFLKILAEYVYKKYSGELENKLLLFPNRRAGLFFRKYYASLTRKPGFMPETATIGDFMSRLSGLQQADPLELSFHIYSSYLKFAPQPESFDDFYPWGEMLISDYNDVDRYLVDAGSLFKNITDLKTIDNVFDYLDEDQKALILRFWKNFDSRKISGQKESFLAIWNLMLPVYQNFRSGLLNEKLGYEGLIYRTVAEEIITGTSFTLPWEHILICGFNALSRSEEKLFLHLRSTSKASFYWDYDYSYVNDDVHEAGRFLRRNIRLLPGDRGFEPGYDNLKEKRTVRVYSLPSDVLQAKQLYSILESENISGDGAEPDPDSSVFHKTSVIFGDESLLPAALTSLPDSIDYLNITMGFPLTQTPVFSFLDAILRLQQFSERRRKDQLFYYRDVLSILDHQYIKSFYSEKVTDLVEAIHKENKIYLDPSEFSGDELLSSIFRKIDRVEEIIEYISELMHRVLISFPADDSKFWLEKEYIFLINTRINKLRNLMEVYPLVVSADGFIRLFRKVMHDFTIPFEGEPLRGIQFMGILESRLLDFQNIIFLSMNEGVIPASSSSYSFIPANLRFAFGMPVKEDKDAIYAYYFYRLLQRAGNIHILYNSKAEGVSSGEPSRYVHQLEYLSGWEIEKFTRSFQVHERQTVAIKIEKKGDVLNLLSEYTRPDSEKYLSPSALTTYMDCPLRFYFSYLAGIREEGEASEEIDASGFGSLYHKSMELIYSDLVGKSVGPEDILFRRKPENVKLYVEQAFREEFHQDRHSKRTIIPEGRNIIIIEIIRKMISQTLDIDLERTPFLLADTEKRIHNRTLHVKGHGQVLLGGMIDRIDLRNHKMHIIDYKTGKAALQFPSLETIFSRNDWKSQDFFKGIFQVFMYSWLYSVENPGISMIVPEIYLTRELFSDNFNPFLKDKSKNSVVENFRDYYQEFESKLLDLLNEIFNPENDFIQTDDENRCKYCPYKDICHRNEE